MPAILTSSDYIKSHYSKPAYGQKGDITSLNYDNWTWVHFGSNGQVLDPYKLLPTIFEEIDVEKLDLLMGSDELADGGAAMMAYAKMQFSEMSEQEREAIAAALLKYCELDTFAMVLLYLHFKEITDQPAKKAA